MPNDINTSMSSGASSQASFGPVDMSGPRSINFSGTTDTVGGSGSSFQALILPAAVGLVVLVGGALLYWKLKGKGARRGPIR